MTAQEKKCTIAWDCYNKYRTGYLQSSGLVEMLDEARRFYAGEQYENGGMMDIPRPIINICNEYVDKVVAKVTGTPHCVEFLAEEDSNDLSKLDDFYRYQMDMIGDDIMNNESVRTAFIDGTAITFTVYDKDAYGGKGLFRGFLRRFDVDADKIFVADPYTQDVQGQRYIGYCETMEIGTVKELIEGSAARKKKIESLIVPDGYDFNSEEKYRDSDRCTVVTRFFRDQDGEVMFEVCTKYADLYETPHYLNPKKNAEKMESEMDDDLSRYEWKGQRPEDKPIYTKPERQSDKEYENEKRKFYRYPVSVYRPDPIRNSFFGQSCVSKVIPNQKIINFGFQMQALIMQSHAMPKYIVKADALRGQVIDNNPNQVITDYSNYGLGAWGISRLNPGDAVNNSLIQFSDNLIALTKQTNGFDNLSSDNMSGDISGYAFQQYVKQASLVLEIPQKRYWEYIKDKAKTDLLYFRHYVDNARFYVVDSDAETAMQESYRNLAESLVENGAVQGNVLPDNVKSIKNKEIRNEDFMKDWEVSVEVQQGIVGSEITESQHVQQTFQMIASANSDPALIKALVLADPSFTKKTRSRVLSAVEAYENSTTQMLRAQIDEYKNAISQMAAQMQRYGQQIDYQAKQVDAIKKASQENAQLNEQAMKAMQTASGSMSEGEVKSANAKGISGGDFGSEWEEIIGE